MINAEIDCLIKLKCDKIVCACHTRGQTVNAVNKFASNWHIEFVTKNLVNSKNRIEEDSANEKDADLLMFKLVS